MTSAQIIYAGSPDFAVPALEALVASPHDVVAVLTQPDKPAGRGRQLRACPVKAAAEQHGLRVLQPEKMTDSLIQAQLKAMTADLFVVAAFGQLLPTEVLAIPRLGCVNLHGSILPRWRGASPIQTAILSGDTETGISLMQMDKGLDTGPVYAESRVAIEPTDTGGSLHDRLAQVGAELLMTHLDGLLDGSLQATPQPDDGVTYARLIKKQDGVIDWQRSAGEIDCRIRAFNPWPVAQTTLDGAVLRCWLSSLADPAEEPAAQPGTVLGVEGDALRIQTGSGQLLLHTVQAAGRKPVSGKAFANARDLSGRVLGD
ncbi:MAG: methionyl-tRNA formyltransferase [Gammaproteobacteria bacterium]|nr:methionyl-tRNA formyltransferase [Gammaproteobacteria bacterium]